MVKLKPHHSLAGIQARFQTADTLALTVSAQISAKALGFVLEDVVDVVQALTAREFVKSETAHTPRNSKVWHDSYVTRYDGFWLYLKFAGETLIDVRLTSFKEKQSWK